MVRRGVECMVFNGSHCPTGTRGNVMLLKSQFKRDPQLQIPFNSLNYRSPLEHSPLSIY